jgi:hypothetical protein
MKKIATLLCTMVLVGSFAFAQDSSKKASSDKKMPAMTTEQRQKMAEAHEKMATCLRSDKALNECHEEMMKACQEGMGKDGCPMMGGKGMHHGHMMHHDESDSKATK